MLIINLLAKTMADKRIVLIMKILYIKIPLKPLQALFTGCHFLRDPIGFTPYNLPVGSVKPDIY